VIGEAPEKAFLCGTSVDVEMGGWNVRKFLMLIRGPSIFGIFAVYSLNGTMIEREETMNLV